MTADSAVKTRPRTNAMLSSKGASTYVQIIEFLSADTVRNVLADAAEQYPEVASRIIRERNGIIAAERAASDGDYDWYLQCVWKLLNADYSCLSALQQYEKSFEVASKIQDYIRAIRDATPASSWDSVKTCALEALRIIGKSVALNGGNAVGDEVIKHFRCNDVLEETMLHIVKSMPPELRAEIARGTFLHMLDELKDFDAEYCPFPEAKAVYLVDVRMALTKCECQSVDEETEADKE